MGKPTFPYLIEYLQKTHFARFWKGFYKFGNVLRPGLRLCRVNFEEIQRANTKEAIKNTLPDVVLYSYLTMNFSRKQVIFDKICVLVSDGGHG